MTTSLRTVGIEPTVEVTTYSPSVDEHLAAVDLVAKRMEDGNTQDIVREVWDGKHGRIGICLRMPRGDFYVWQMRDGSVVRTKEQVPPEMKR